MRGGMDVPSDITTVFFKLMVILKSLQALAKRSHRFRKCISEWATRAASSAYSNSGINTRLVLAFSAQPGKVKQPAGATSVEHDSILLWESVCKKSWKKYAKQCWRQDAALFDASVNWKSFRHGAIKLDSCLHVLVERYLQRWKVAFQGSPKVWVCYTNQPAHRIEGFGQVQCFFKPFLGVKMTP